MFEKLKNALRGINTTAQVAVGSAVATLASGSAMAQTDYTSLTDAVDWSDVSTALLAVGAAIVTIMVVFKGIKLVVRAVKGA